MSESTLTLVTFPPAFGLRNVSPFCLKVEMALAHLDIPFQIREQADPRKAPKGKLPYIEDDGGQVIADSELILQHLDDKTDGALYGHHSAEENALGVAMTRLADDHLYWMMVASRWLDDDWWPEVKKGFFAAFPPVLRDVVGVVARSSVRKTYDLHGLGRHTLEEQRGFAARDLEAIDRLMADRPFLLGDELSVYDFGVASLLAGLLDNRPPTWLTEMAQGYSNLAPYAERVQETVGVYCRERPDEAKAA